MGAKRDSKESQRDQKLMDMELEGMFNSLLGGWRDLMQRLRAAERQMNNTRDRSELIVRNIYKAKGMVREAR